MRTSLPNRRLYLDLDGVFADFDAAFPDVFGMDHRSMANDDMWAKINAHPSFFRDLPPCDGSLAGFAALEQFKPTILTSCPRTNYQHVAGQKRAWVRQHFGQHITVLPVMGGHNKPLFMHSDGDVLLDDFRKNCDAWAKAGGTAILHRSWPESVGAVVEAILSEVRS